MTNLVWLIIPHLVGNSGAHPVLVRQWVENQHNTWSCEFWDHAEKDDTDIGVNDNQWAIEYIIRRDYWYSEGASTQSGEGWRGR